LTDDAVQGVAYFPYHRFAQDTVFITVRSAGALDSMGADLQRIVREINPELPVTDLRTMEQRVEDSVITRRSSALLTGLFAGVALLLTAIGTYGVLSFGVAQRRREIGLRMALGAGPAVIRRQFLTSGAWLIISGLAIGLVGTVAAGHAMSGMLFGVPPLHPPALMAAAAILAMVALLACLIPALRAARTSPMAALNEQPD
jgi:ABC-type antimicrobial peptide transport system permease subunit